MINYSFFFNVRDPNLFLRILDLNFKLVLMNSEHYFKQVHLICTGILIL
jgi:hypothetical protein